MKKAELAKVPRKRSIKLPKPEIYNAFIKSLEIEDIFLKNMHVDYITESIKQPAKVHVSMKAKYFNYSPDYIKIYHNYAIIMRGQDSEEDDIIIECSFVVIYKSPKKMTRSLFQIFEKLNLPVNTWPYMREFVHNTLKRMNIPSVIAPAYKVP